MSDRINALIVQAAERAEAEGVAIDGENGGEVHQWVMRNCSFAPGQDFYIVFLLTAEMADREARRQGFKDQADRASHSPAFLAAKARYDAKQAKKFDPMRPFASA